MKLIVQVCRFGVDSRRSIRKAVYPRRALDHTLNTARSCGGDRLGVM
jgi:hypothetical protein